MIRLYLIFLLQFFSVEIFSQKTERPNILWISCEDLSPHFTFYGDSTVRTPNLEKLAREGVVYDNVFATAGVCAPSRCAIITGKNQVSVGGHNMRTLYSTFPEKTGLPGSYSIVPPVGVKAFPELLRAQGYYCTNNVKTDYQFEAPPTVWDEVSDSAHWRKRKSGQPFFAVFNITLTHESQVWQRKNHPLHADPASIKVPPYYPDTKTVRADMARFFSNIVDMDSVAGSILKQLEADGLLENTIVFFWSDHGDGLPFVKREVYDRGLKIPLVIRYPDKYRAGKRETKLISTIDLAPTVLSLAGVPVPSYMEGKSISALQTNQYIYAARDRMDSEYDRVRAVRDQRYKYIRNFHPELPRYQNIEFRLQQDMMKEILELKEQEKLDKIQSAWFEPTKPREELYDLQNDPYEFKNLAADPVYQSHVVRLRAALDRWMKEIKDMGAIPEKELVRLMWQGKDTPPATEPATVVIKNNVVTVSCVTRGASIGYKIIEPGKPEPEAYTVYTKPFVLESGRQLKVFTQRIGFEKTERIILPGEFKVNALRCDHIANPLGIENKNPLLSWEIVNSAGNMVQSAYEIMAASSLQKLEKNEADLWNTGKVRSSRSAYIRYNGKPLSSRQQCFWKVRVWDQQGNVTDWSAPYAWEMGLLQRSDWKAKWISRTKDNDSVRPAPLFRKEITLTNAPVKKARAYISGLGYYELSINGKKIGNNELDPVVTRYDKRVAYVCHDITSQFQKGKNAIGVLLGNGWYNYHTRAVWDFENAAWRNAPVLIAQFEIEYADGSKQIIVTDESWTTSTGPIIFDGIMNGETYDARLEKPGWNTPDFNDAGWQAAIPVAGPSGKLTAQLMPAISGAEKNSAHKFTQVKPGVWVVDFGVAIAGRVHLAVTGTAGTTITIKYGEKLNPDGTLDQRELARFIRSGSTQTDRYILKGAGTEEWASRFVYHGFQYVEITGYAGELSYGNVSAEALNTNFQNAGTFHSSNTLLNKLHAATRRSFVSNYHSYPTDCPHREKIGWSGDAQLIVETALFNFDMTQSYLKWLDDFTDEQKDNGQVPGIIPSSGWGYTYGNDPSTRDRGYGPQWEGAYITIPWNLYLYTGDSSIIKKYYPGMKRYIDYLAANAKNYLLDFGIDDHKFFKTPVDPPIIASSYFHSLTVILSKMAAVVGKKDDATHYTALASKIKQSFNATFTANGGQTATALALYHGLTNSEVMLKNLIDSIRAHDFHFDAGVLGVKAITNVLIKNRRAEELYAILNNPTYPSPGYWISKGATTLWQDWLGERSLNHIMFGSFADFFYQALAGINPDPLKPGFKQIIFSPQFVKDLQTVSAKHHSPYGWIESEWKREGNKIIYTCSVPANCTAILKKPNGATQLLTSGTFRFEFQP